MRKILLSLIVLAAATPVMAFPFTMTAAGPLASVNTAPGAPNGQFTFNYAGPSFTAGTVSFSGSLTEVNTGTFASEARFCLTNPGGTRYCSSSLTTTGNFTGTVVISNTNVPFVTGSPTNPVNSVLNGSTVNPGTWTAGFYESYDDSGTDANWNNVSITVNDFVPPTPPASAINLGNIIPGQLQGNNAHNGATVSWYKFTVAPGVPLAGGYVVVDTVGTALSANSFGTNDTHIGLYNSLGNKIGDEDDIEFSGTPRRLESRLRFGDTTGFSFVPAIGSSETAGAFASLTAGTYYLAVTGFPGTFGTTGFNVTTTSTTTGTVHVNVWSNVPEPTTLALLGIGALALIRRRR